MRVDVFVGLGSNLGARLENLREALGRLRAVDVKVGAVSSVYESAPIGPVSEQPAFLNAVVRVEATADARALLATCQRIEDEMGRRREREKGPRCIDLDLLLVGGELHDAVELKVPHPALTERAFVLLPLLEIAPRLKHPRDGRPLARHLPDLLAYQEITRIGGPELLGRAAP